MILVAIEDSIKEIVKRIRIAKEKSIYDQDVTIVVVSKNQDVDKIKEVSSYGRFIFGENRVQELLAKTELLDKENFVFHQIGHLQTNKVRQIIDKVDLIHSLDSIKLAEEINKRACQLGVVSEVLIQVNMAGEKQKYGVPPYEVEEFINVVKDFQSIKIVGLMFIAPNYDDKNEARPYFKQMRLLFDKIKADSIENVDFKWLSMGMSDDFEVAIEEGSNMIRVGSAVFK